MQSKKTKVTDKEAGRGIIAKKMDILNLPGDSLRYSESEL